ncbi:MAG: Crp/Fnr family transcriptional regulator [Deltaproteobacteria bacterium]|nr:Crp/Fnr family transcriptional regulator [Deltaproteobacteria bacterium]
MASKCNFCTIRKTTIFADLKEDELNRIERLIIEKTFPKRHIIFWEDDAVKNIYLIKRGNVKLYKTQSDGRSQILNIYGTGGILGFDSLFGNKYLTTGETIAESVLCQIKVKDFRELLEKEPAINLQLLKAVSRELEKNENLLFTLGTRTAKERISYFLFNLYNSQCDCEDNPKKINLLISRQEISEHLGMKQETVIRNLSKLKDEKIIDIKGKEIVILDSEVLEENALGSPNTP